jgi:hypothetical protein
VVEVGEDLQSVADQSAGFLLVRDLAIR